MYEIPPDCVAIERSRHREPCLEHRLVLDAAGIAAEAGYLDGWWLLVVRHEDRLHASSELDAYRAENPPGKAPAPVRVPIYGGARAGVLGYAVIVIVVAVLSGRWAFGLEWLPAGRMQTGRVLDGEWWRTLTALSLHIDAGHVTANLIFGAVFGFLAGQALGGGVAWLAIVVSGGLGNLMNALAQDQTHSSIGASTAVFAALGILVSHALRYRGALSGGPLRRWSPLVGGILLLAYTGTGGERTDIVAHLTGFLSGLGVGWIGSRIPHALLSNPEVQRNAGIAAVMLVVVAWATGLILYR